MTKEKKQESKIEQPTAEEKKPVCASELAEKQLAEMRELLQRTQANFENYRKQQEKRTEEIRNFAGKDMILQVLPLLDNFNLALKNTKCEKGEFIKGIELIYSQLYSFLESNEVRAIETKNKIFDPFYHEALIKVDSDLPENTIVEELQKGFTLHGKVIRHAKVKISVGKKEKPSSEKIDQTNSSNTNNSFNDSKFQ